MLLPVFDSTGDVSAFVARRVKNSHEYQGPFRLDGTLRVHASISDPNWTIYRGVCVCGVESADLPNWQACWSWHREHLKSESAS